MERVQTELAELGEECVRVIKLLQRLERVRTTRRDAGDVLADLSVAVTHIHVHTKGLDRLIENLLDD